MSVPPVNVGRVRQEITVDLDPATIIDVVGPSAYDRGVGYAQQGMVERAVWRASAGALPARRSRSAALWTTATPSAPALTPKTSAQDRKSVV